MFTHFVHLVLWKLIYSDFVLNTFYTFLSVVVELKTIALNICLIKKYYKMNIIKHLIEM